MNSRPISAPATGRAVCPQVRHRITFRQAFVQTLSLSWRGIAKLPRHPMSLADVIIGPAIFLVLFAYVFGGAVAGSTQDYLDYVFPGIVGFTVLFASMGVGTALSVDMSTGVFDRFRSLPILRIAPLMGAIGTDIVRQLISLTAVMGFGLLLGVRFESDVWSVLAACGVAIGFGLAFSWVWVLLALAVKDTQAVQGLGAVVIFPLVFISNIFVPTETMPGWLEAAASWNPAGHLVETIRGLLMGGGVAEPLVHTLLWAAGLILIFAPLSLVVYNRRA